MKNRILWIYILCAMPILIFGFFLVCGLITFTPLSSLLGDRWHYNGGVGLGRLVPLPNQSAILYSSSRTGTSHIYSVIWNGHISQQLTNDLRGDSDVAVSPNNKQIAFVRQDGDSTHLWLMNTNGAAQHQITFGPDSQTQPCFSPNGKQIAYVNSPHYGIWRIWLINTTGRGQRQLTNTNEQDTTPAFDKTGTTVFYSHYSDTVDRLQLYSVTISGGLPILLGFGTRPTVSPNGTQIAFYDEPQNQTLAVMNTNGTGRRIIGSSIGDGMDLAYCPDGRLLTYKPSSQPNTDNLAAINPKNGTFQTVATIDASSHYPDR